MISRDYSQAFASLWARGDRITQRISLAVSRSVSRLAGAEAPVAMTVPRDITHDPLEREIHFAANTDVSVLITAQTLAEARRIARAIHERCPNAHHHSVTVVSADLTINRVVTALQTGSGVVVFEDVGAFGDDLQAVLLELLESQVSRASEPRFSRILSTGLPDLFSRVERGLLRKELFYRLNTIHINVCLPRTVDDGLVTGGVDGPRVFSH